MVEFSPLVSKWILTKNVFLSRLYLQILQYFVQIIEMSSTILFELLKKCHLLNTQLNITIISSLFYALFYHFVKPFFAWHKIATKHAMKRRVIYNHRVSKKEVISWFYIRIIGHGHALSWLSPGCVTSGIKVNNHGLERIPIAGQITLLHFLVLSCL